MKMLDFEGKWLTIDGKSIEMDYRIRNARIIDNKAIVLFEFDESVPRYRQFQNCVAIDANGDTLWIAEHPSNQTADSYVDFVGTTDHRLWNFAGFVCTLDFETGRLKNAGFTK